MDDTENPVPETDGDDEDMEFFDNLEDEDILQLYDDDDDEDYDDSPTALEVMDGTLSRFLDTAAVESVYGEPVEHADSLVIPAAEVVSGMGFGLGSGSGQSPQSEGDEEGKSGYGEGTGGGGGGYTMARPVAVIIASPEGVRVEPVVDVTKIAMAALTAFGFVFSMMMRMRRGQIE